MKLSAEAFVEILRALPLRNVTRVGRRRELWCSQEWEEDTLGVKLSPPTPHPRPAPAPPLQSPSQARVGGAELPVT